MSAGDTLRSWSLVLIGVAALILERVLS